MHILNNLEAIDTIITEIYILDSLRVKFKVMEESQVQ